jgi:hypothetical protein
MKIIIRDNLGKDVTHEREWYINTDGKIFYYTGDIDGPLYIVDNDYTWEVQDDIVYNIFEESRNDWLQKALSELHVDRDKFVYYATNVDDLKKYCADADRISQAKERTKKYIK